MFAAAADVMSPLGTTARRATGGGVAAVARGALATIGLAMSFNHQVEVSKSSCDHEPPRWGASRLRLSVRELCPSNPPVGLFFRDFTPAAAAATHSKPARLEARRRPTLLERARTRMIRPPRCLRRC